MVNYLAVLVAAIAHMAVGMIWYGPLFGKTWMKLVGLTEKDVVKAKKQGMGKTMLVTFLSGAVTAFVLAFTMEYLQVHTVMLAMQIAFWLWLGFTAAVQLPHFLYERKSLKLYGIGVAYELAYILVMAIVVAIW